MDPLDTDTAVPSDLLDLRTPFFHDVAAHWPDKRMVGALTDTLHDVDLKRAREQASDQEPPVVHVTMAGVDGHFTKTLGEEEISFSPGPAPGLSGGE